MDETVTLTEYEAMVIRCLLVDRQRTLQQEIDDLVEAEVSQGLINSYKDAMAILEGLQAKFPFKILSASLAPKSLIR